MKLTFLKLVFFVILIHPPNIFAEGKISFHAPEFVQNGKEFELVYLYKVEPDSNTSYELSIALTRLLQFGKCEIVAPSKTEKISLKELFGESKFSTIHRLVFNPISLGFRSGESFQIIVRLVANNSSSVIVNSRFLVSVGDSVVSQFPSAEIPEQDYHQSEISFYQPEIKAGKHLQLKNNSYLNFTVTTPAEKVVIENWFKYEGRNFTFFNIIDQTKNDTLIQFSISDFRHLFISKGSDLDFFETRYLSSKTWYHFISELDFSSNQIKIYVNSQMIGMKKIRGAVTLKDFLFSFFNEKEKTKSNIENLRIWNAKNELDFFYKQKNYSYVKTDSSTQLRFLQFESTDEFNLDKSMILNFENINLVKSDAPVFSQTLEISVEHSASGYLIKWESGDDTQVEKYVVERSLQGNDFSEIYSTDANFSENEEFSFIAEYLPQNNFVYFRIKQINIDGTSAYSKSIKVGQGIVENFEIKQNYPNPFNPKTSIKVLVLNESEVEINVYNLSGKHVMDIFKGTLKKGEHSFEFDGSTLPSGMYLYTVKSPLQSESRKMILAK